LKLSSRVRQLLNDSLAKFNLELSTLTALKLERERVRKLAGNGYFDRPTFPLLKAFSSFDASLIVEGYAVHQADCRRLLIPDGQSHRYDPVNNFFPPADACLTYLIARIFAPKIWFEVGSGNSTRVVRQAIEDGRLATTLVCVDPNPRVDISSIADEIVRAEVELLPAQDTVERLNGNDVLFIDSSHELKAGGDVIHLLLNVVPKLRPGVLVHIHDVFLPYDYPRRWVEDYPTLDEQYVVQAMLQFGIKFEVIWPGYYVQKCRPEISSKLDFLSQGSAQSLWLRVLASDAP
jgi:predicted O-methyltransferase YrrM